jgi:polar amino acid transport system substrate-binding protein
MSYKSRMQVRQTLFVVPIICTAVALTACGSSSSGSSTPSAAPSSTSAATSSAAAAPTTTAAASDTNDLGTLKPGVIQVAVEPYMPYSGKVGSQFEGLDIDLLRQAAADLHQKVTFTLTDLAGTIASTTTHRVDMTLGSLTWTTARAKAGLFTDPTYYSPPAALVKQGTDLKSLADFSGKTIGVETGSNFAEAIAKVPGVSPKYYTGVAQGLLDLQSGRTAAYLTDPLVAAYAAKQSATKGLVLDYYTPPTQAQLKAQPLYANFAPYQVAMFLNKNETGLEAALNKEIDSFYKNGVLAKTVRKWGGDPSAFMKTSPVFSSQRQGVDRPANWQAPSAG